MYRNDPTTSFKDIKFDEIISNSDLKTQNCSEQEIVTYFLQDRRRRRHASFRFIVLRHTFQCMYDSDEPGIREAL